MADHNPFDEDPRDDGVFDDGDPPTNDANAEDGPNPYDLAEPVGHDDPTAPPPPAPILQAPEANILRCQQCQQDLTGATLGGNCPNCGAPIVANGFPSQLGSGKATTALVLGICSIPMCMCCGLIGIILGPLAIYFGKEAQKDIHAGVAAPTSEGMAKAGVTCGIIGTSLNCVALLINCVTNVLPILLEL